MPTKIEHNSVANLFFETNKKLGYYLVDNEIYYNKFDALISASKTNGNVRWFFNEHVFVNYNWEVEPQESLKELYRRRAQQLRDQYDYIRIEASGGADSTTVIFSFLLNDIHLDEVVFRYPKSGEKDVTGDPWDLRCENTLSEWQFAARPLLDWIATNYPKTKVTVHDYTEKFQELVDETWIYRTRHYLQPGHAVKHHLAGTADQQRILEKGKKVCVVWGVDKPKVCIKDNKFFLYFVDGQGNHNNQVVNEYNNVTNEFFYWSPDACDLLAKQAHMIKHWFEMPEHANMTSVLHWPNSNFSTRTIYEQVVKSLIYPDYDLNTFQTYKPTNNIYNEMDHWFHHNYQGTHQYNVWKAGIDYLINNLNPEYVGYSQGRAMDIVMYESPLYYFGENSIKEPTVSLSTKALLKNHKIDPLRKHRHAIKGKIEIY